MVFRVGAIALFFLVGTSEVVGAHRQGTSVLRITDKVVRYPIQGASARAIQRQLENHGPMAAGSGHGRTHSALEVDAELEQATDECHLRGFELSVEITMTLPEWQAPSRAPTELRNNWETAFSQLLRHEAGHRAHAVEAAYQLHSELLRLPSQQNCFRLQHEIDSQLRMATLQLRLRGRLYDELTENGLRDEEAPRP